MHELRAGAVRRRCDPGATLRDVIACSHIVRSRIRHVDRAQPRRIGAFDRSDIGAELDQQVGRQRRAVGAKACIASIDAPHELEPAVRLDEMVQLVRYRVEQTIRVFWGNGAAPYRARQS